MADFISSANAATGAITGAATAVNTASNLATAISAGYGADSLAGAIRAIDLPAAGEAIGDIMGAVASFSDTDNPNDWRVRLSIAKWTSFQSSPVLKPLKDAGALIFPYTPKINITSSATYSSSSNIVHSNYKFQAFQSSNPGQITITAPMYVSDPTEGLYWIAMVHYLRSLTKMFAGNDPKAGNPPPVVMLNGYGNYVFKNVPVVVTKMSVDLAQECDYIGVNVVGSAAGEIQGITDSIGGLSDSLGSVLGGFGGEVAGAVSSIAGGIGQIAGLADSLGIGGEISGGVSHVPTKSTFTIDLMPIYSRDSVRKFSLDRFVSGGYLNNPFGYI
jgi:hypothetical protein